MADEKSRRALEAARDSLAALARYSFRKFQKPRHISYAIEQLERGEIDRLMIFMPPRYGKSCCRANCSPAGYWASIPTRM
jgi:hypothetical protein